MIQFAEKQNRGKLNTSYLLPARRDWQRKKSQNWSLYDATYTSWVKTKTQCLDRNADFPLIVWMLQTNKRALIWNYKRRRGQWKNILPSLLLCWNDIWEKERSSDIFDLKWCNPDELPKIHWNFKASNVNVSTIKQSNTSRNIYVDPRFQHFLVHYMPLLVLFSSYLREGVKKCFF